MLTVLKDYGSIVVLKTTKYAYLGNITEELAKQGLCLLESPWEHSIHKQEGYYSLFSSGESKGVLWKIAMGPSHTTGPNDQIAADVVVFARRVTS